MVVHVTEEPAQNIRPGECVALKVKFTDDDKDVVIKSARFVRVVGKNGLLYYFKHADGEVYLLARLVNGDEELVLAQSDDGKEIVIQTQEYTKNKNSVQYYRPKAHSVFQSGLILEKNEASLFIKILIPSPCEE